MASSSWLPTHHIGLPMDIERKSFAAVLLCWALVSQGTSVGVIGGDGKALHLYTPAPLKAGQSVQFQTLGAEGKLTCCTKRTAQDFMLVTASSPVMEFDSQKAVYQYRLLPARSHGLRVSDYWGGAVIGQAQAQSKSPSDKLQFRLKGLRTLQVRSCVSAEGFHVLGVHAGEIRDHLYVPLGYEVSEPSCPAAMFKNQ